MRTNGVIALVTAGLVLMGSQSSHASDLWGLKVGSPELKSASSLAFGPDGILLVGDSKAATIYAIATDNTGKANAKLQVEDLGGKISKALGSKAELVDLAVNPTNGQVYLSAKTATKAALLVVDARGKVSLVTLKDVKYSKLVLPNAPEDKVVQRGRRSSNRRDEAITDLAYVEGKVLVSGLTASEAASAVRSIPFPFTTADTGATIEIYHAAHGKTENSSAIRTFVPFNINGKPNLLAGFTCTPLVKFPIGDLASGTTVKGTTVAELGNRNRPYDVIVYKKDGKDWLLMANDRRGVMKISTENIERSTGITEPVRGGGQAGQTYVTIEDLAGTVQLDKLTDETVVVVIDKDGDLTLKTVALP